MPCARVARHSAGHCADTSSCYLERILDTLWPAMRGRDVAAVAVSFYKIPRRRPAAATEASTASVIHLLAIDQGPRVGTLLMVLRPARFPNVSLAAQHVIHITVRAPYNTPARQSRARLSGSSRRPAPTHTRTHKHARTRAQAHACDRAHAHAPAPARERESERDCELERERECAHAHAHARKRTPHMRTHTRPHQHPRLHQGRPT